MTILSSQNSLNNYMYCQLYATSLVQLYDLVSPHVLILRTRKKTANVSGYILEIHKLSILHAIYFILKWGDYIALQQYRFYRNYTEMIQKVHGNDTKSTRQWYKKYTAMIQKVHGNYTNIYTAMIQKLHDNDTKITRQLCKNIHGNDTKIIRQWYKNYTAMIQKLHGNDTKITRQCYKNCTAMLQKLHGNVTKIARQWYKNIGMDMSRDHTVLVWCTAYNLWTFTLWTPFQAERDWQNSYRGIV